MAVVAVHQPNYLPWLGYFAKIARADEFVFFDDVQFSKGGYTNRTRIDNGGEPEWLTVSVKVSLGDRIDQVSISNPAWPREHTDRLRERYKGFAFVDVFLEEYTSVLKTVEPSSLSETNIALIEWMAKRLGITVQFSRSSGLGFKELKADDRLIALVSKIDPGGTYLSGRGGAKYQDETKFTDAGIELIYTAFEEPSYRKKHIGGLSAADAIILLGWETASKLIRQGNGV